MTAVVSWPARAAIAIVVAAAVLWVFPAPGYWVFTANAGLVLAATTLGLMVVTGWLREVSLVQAGLTGTAVYLCAWAYRPGETLEWPFLPAAAVGIAAAVAVSVLISIVSARLPAIYIMGLTLALQVAIERTIFASVRLSGGGIGSPGPVHLHRVPRPSFFGVDLVSDRSYYLFSLAVLGALTLLLARIRTSRFGQGMLLLGVDRQVAAAVGVSPWRFRILAFGLAGFCAGVAGALTAPLFTIPPGTLSYAALPSLFFLAIPVLAGFRSLIGLVAVAVVFSLAPQALEHYRISPFTLAAAGLLLGTLAGPNGLSGVVLDAVQARIRRRASRGERLPSSGDAIEVLGRYLPERHQGGEVLATESVSVTFGGVRALQEVSIRVPAGQIVGLIGPNGAGKTTLFDVINGLRVPNAGRVRLLGEDITTARPWERAERGLSRTFQDNRLNFQLTVKENLLSGAYTMIPGNLFEAIVGLGGAPAGLRRAEDAAWAVAELLDISRYWDEPARVLSHGNRRRVEIGRSLMSGPRLLLLDEPSAGLDPNAAQLLFSVITELQRSLGLTVILVEHHVPTVLELCDLIYVLAQGEVIVAGPPDEIALHPEVRATYLGPDFIGVPG